MLVVSVSEEKLVIHSSYCKKTTAFVFEQRLTILVLVAIAMKFEINRDFFLCF